MSVSNIDKEISGLLQSISTELKGVTNELRDSEIAIHKIVQLSNWELVSKEIQQLQNLDFIVQKLDVISTLTKKLSKSKIAPDTLASTIDSIPLESVRMNFRYGHLNNDAKSSISGGSIDLF